MMNERADCSGCALREVPLCRSVREAGDDRLSPAVSLRRHGPNEMLYEVGAHPGVIGVLRKGCLRRERLMPDGRRTVLGLVFPGDIVGELPDRRAGYSLETATEAEICHFPISVARRVPAESTEFRRVMAADAERQLDHELTFAWLRVGLRCRERVIAFLVWAAGLPSSRPQPEGGVLADLPVGRRDWADLCNTTVESISRQMTDLSSRGLVAHLDGRRYLLRDLPALRRLAGLDRLPCLHCAPSRMTAVNADLAAAVPSVAVRAPVLGGVAWSQ